MKDIDSTRAEMDYLRLELRRISSQLRVEKDISARSLLHDKNLTALEQLRVLHFKLFELSLQPQRSPLYDALNSICTYVGYYKSYPHETADDESKSC